MIYSLLLLSEDTSITDGLLIFSENLRDAEKMFLGATFMCAFLLLLQGEKTADEVIQLQEKQQLHFV